MNQHPGNQAAARRTFSDLPYKVHTNRELGMMLRGLKPLAVFVGVEGLSVVERYLRLFDRHVATGRLVKRAYFETGAGGSGSRIDVTLYALPSEGWRIDAMIDLRSKLGEGWTDADERLEGNLLGYSAIQNDIWIDRLRAKRGSALGIEPKVRS